MVLPIRPPHRCPGHLGLPFQCIREGPGPHEGVVEDWKEPAVAHLRVLFDILALEHGPGADARLLEPVPVPATWIRLPNNSSFSVIVVFPASG